jgi:phage terminase small subunit
MGVPKRLSEMQIKFANLLVSNEGRLYAYECAIEAGYEKDRARQTASELQNPKKYPLVVSHIGKLREENQKKYEVTYGRHITELGKIREAALRKGAFSAANNAEVARGKAAGLYVEQKIIRTGKIDDMSPEDLKKRMAEILEDYSGVIEGESTEDIEKKVKAKQAKIRTDVNEREKSKKTKPLSPLRKVNISDKEVTPSLTSSSSSHKTEE